MCRFFLTLAKSLVLWTPTGCPTSKLGSDADYPDLAADSAG